MRSLPVVVATALALAGCSSTTEAEFLLNFRVDRFDRSSGELPGDVAEVSPGLIRVTGGLQTPCLASGGEIRGTVQLDGQTILLQVRWSPSQACQPGVDAFTYLAEIRNVPAGTYQLMVTHVFPDEGGYVALDQSITVP